MTPGHFRAGVIPLSDNGNELERNLRLKKVVANKQLRLAWRQKKKEEKEEKDW